MNSLAQDHMDYNRTQVTSAVYSSVFMNFRSFMFSTHLKLKNGSFTATSHSSECAYHLGLSFF